MLYLCERTGFSTFRLAIGHSLTREEADKLGRPGYVLSTTMPHDVGHGFHVLWVEDIIHRY